METPLSCLGVANSAHLYAKERHTSMWNTPKGQTVETLNVWAQHASGDILHNVLPLPRLLPPGESTHTAKMAPKGLLSQLAIRNKEVFSRFSGALLPRSPRFLVALTRASTSVLRHVAAKTPFSTFSSTVYQSM